MSFTASTNLVTNAPLNTTIFSSRRKQRATVNPRASSIKCDIISPPSFPSPQNPKPHSNSKQQKRQNSLLKALTFSGTAAVATVFLRFTPVIDSGGGDWFGGGSWLGGGVVVGRRRRRRIRRRVLEETVLCSFGECR
ncbi:hypothetical protein NC651_000022 [Populus alba x Populus x berolinensis]|nr:hypothetical protein NC651_000022 [Populus alba x Populus x berolinensis]